MSRSTVGTGVLVDSVTVILPVPVWLSPSVAVTVMVLAPVANPILLTLQETDMALAPQEAQVAVPLVGVQVGQAQVTLVTPISSAAVPASVVRGELPRVTSM